MERTLENSPIEQFSYLAAGTMPVLLHLFFYFFKFGYLFTGLSHF